MDGAIARSGPLHPSLLAGHPIDVTPTVRIVSSRTLEDWSPETPWVTGIGGSEQSHIEMTERLQARDEFPVLSYAPLPDGFTRRGWARTADHLDDIFKGPGVVINYRDSELFKHSKPRGQKWWFVAQDVDYTWTEEALSRVDRYLCLCQEHAKYTASKYGKILKGKLFISSNGVRSDIISDLQRGGALPARVPGRMLYASSPDRGLQLLLEQWWRVRERVPNASLHVAYGFNNIDTIIKAFADQGRAMLRADIERLLNQPGVTWLGRLPQNRLYEEWAEASVWPYPSDWPETSCITCMDAQALGALPVTTNYWAQGENVRWGYKSDGLPQKSALARSIWLDNLYDALTNPFAYEVHRGVFNHQSNRERMMAWALDKFNWERVVDQWTNWLREDLKPRIKTAAKGPAKKRTLARAAGVSR